LLTERFLASVVEAMSPTNLVESLYQEASSLKASSSLTPTSSEAGADQNHTLKTELMKVNVNMASAFTHVGADTLRTASVFIAAVVVTVSNVSGDIADAWAAVVVTITIFCAVIPLSKEIYRAMMRLRAEQEAERDYAEPLQ
jgi:Co/Zn/Cd efflux system component